MATQRTARTRRRTSAGKQAAEVEVKEKSIPKPTTPPRTRERIEDTESTKNTKKSVIKEMAGGRAVLLDGEVEIIAQMSETVPVAQYANVNIGPVGVRWTLTGADMNLLADADWSDEDAPLTAEQTAAYDRVLNGLRASTHLASTILAEDRAVVEESVRLHNLQKSTLR